MNNEKKKFSEIINQVMMTLQITPYALAMTIKTTPAKIYAWQDGAIPKLDSIALILEAFPQLNERFLTLGEGNVFRETELNTTFLGVYGDMEFVEVPYLNIKTQAAYIATYENTPPITLEMYPILKNEVNLKNCMLIEVNGNSMSPTIKDKAKLLAQKVEPEDWGDMYGVIVILYKDYLVVKRIRENELNHLGKLTLYTDNPNGGTITINSSDIKEMWKGIMIYQQLLE